MNIELVRGRELFCPSIGHQFSLCIGLFSVVALVCLNHELGSGRESTWNCGPTVYFGARMCSESFNDSQGSEMPNGEPRMASPSTGLHLQMPPTVAIVMILEGIIHISDSKDILVIPVSQSFK